MVLVDIGDHGHDRLQVQKRGVALNCFCYQIASCTQTRVAVGALESATNHKRGVFTAFGQHTGDQTGGRRLARACQRRRRPRENASARRASRARGTTGNASGQRGLHFRVVCGHGARGDNDVRPDDVFRAMADVDLRTERAQPLGGLIGLQVRALHAIAQIQQHLPRYHSCQPRRCRRNESSRSVACARRYRAAPARRAA